MNRMSFTDFVYQDGDAHIECQSLAHAVDLLMAAGCKFEPVTYARMLPPAQWEAQGPGEVLTYHFFGLHGMEIASFKEYLSTLIPALWIYDLPIVWDPVRKVELTPFNLEMYTDRYNRKKAYDETHI